MKKQNIYIKSLLSFLLLLVLINTHAQTGLNFQGVARTSNNIILASQQISLRLSIIQGSAIGATEYTETRKVNTNAQGLFNAVIGDTGAISSIGNFATINWKATPKFLKIEMDPAAGANFITMGTTQFQNVAYAMFANSVDAENIVGIVPVARGGTGATSLALLPISTATQNVLDLKLNKADTVKFTKQTWVDSALVSKLKVTDTANLSARIDAKANIDSVNFVKDITVNGLIVGKGAANIESNTVFGKGVLIGNTTGANNVAIGFTSLNRNTIGSSNVAIGYGAMPANTEGSNNIAIGVGTMQESTTGSKNIAIGNSNLYGLSTGSKNIAIGNAAMIAISTGEGNIAIGDEAFGNASTGIYNTVIGAQAKIADGTYSNATALGYGASADASNSIQLGNIHIKSVNTSGAYIGDSLNINKDAFISTFRIGRGNGYIAHNLAFGHEALNANTTGEQNMALGYSALNKNTTGGFNTATGFYSLYSNVDGSRNSAFGRESLLSNTAGNSNTAIGEGTLTTNTTGSGNTSVGTGALHYNTTGSNNTSVGVSSMYASNGDGNAAFGRQTLLNNTSGNENTAIGSMTLRANTTGDYNTALGSASLRANTTGTKNTAVGYAALMDNTTYSNSTGIGNNAQVTGSNQIQLGNSEVTLVNTSGAIAAGLGTSTIAGKLRIGGNTDSSASAALEVSSTSKGFLPPRMNNYQKTQIASPIAGLTIWCSNCGESGEMQVFNGAAWTNMSGGTATGTISLSIGNSYQGGIVAYILVSGDPGYDANTQHGLIAATSDQSTGIRWYNVSYTTTGATGTAIGTGLSNTNTIITSQGATSTSYAAGLARAYTGGGYTDWYLPSKDELAKLYAMKVLGFGGFANNYYWSSTELASSFAWFQYFDGGFQTTNDKNYNYYVRAIRAF